MSTEELKEMSGGEGSGSTILSSMQGEDEGYRLSEETSVERGGGDT